MCRLRLPLLARAEHIDRQYLLRFTPPRQNLSRAIHAAAVVAGSSSTGIVRASGANPYNKGRLRPLGWMRLQVTVWHAGARSSCGASSSSVLRPEVQRLAPACEHRRKSSALAHRVRACTSGSSTHSGCNHMGSGACATWAGWGGWCRLFVVGLAGLVSCQTCAGTMPGQLARGGPARAIWGRGLTGCGICGVTYTTLVGRGES